MSQKLLTGINYPDGWPDDLLREWCRHFGYPEPDWMVVKTVENNYLSALYLINKATKNHITNWITKEPTYGFGLYPYGKKIQENIVWSEAYNEQIVDPPDSNQPYTSWDGASYATYGKVMYPDSPEVQAEYEKALERAKTEIVALVGKVYKSP